MDRNFELVRFISIGILVLNLLIGIFVAFFSQGLAISIPAISQINSYESAITSAGNNIAWAFNGYQFLKIASCNQGDYFCAAYDTGALIIDFLASVISVIINILVIFGVAIAVIFLVMTGVIPQLLTSFKLGIIADLLLFIESAASIIVGYYILVLLLELWRAIRGN